MTRVLTSQEIIKVLDHLIGITTAVGDSWVDEKIMLNLKTLIDVTNWCIDGVHQSSETMCRPESSMHNIGWTANCALDEWRVWLNELFEEGKQNE